MDLLRHSRGYESLDNIHRIYNSKDRLNGRRSLDDTELYFGDILDQDLADRQYINCVNTWGSPDSDVG